MRIPIARQGYCYIFSSFVITILISRFSLFASLPFWCLSLLILNFFRDPERRVPGDKNAVIAPADGKIIEISESDIQGGFENCFKISIFMNVFNVHVNRSPVDGKIVSIQHFPGLFLNAADKRSSLENERMEIELATEHGPILVRLVAGLIARRIVAMCQPDCRLKQGDRISIIKFGSRVDIYLPKTAVIQIGMGDHVKAGETRLAHFSSHSGGSTFE